MRALSAAAIGGGRRDGHGGDKEIALGWGVGRGHNSRTGYRVVSEKQSVSQSVKRPGEAYVAVAARSLNQDSSSSRGTRCAREMSRA